MDGHDSGEGGMGAAPPVGGTLEDEVTLLRQVIGTVSLLMLCVGAGRREAAALAELELNQLMGAYAKRFATPRNLAREAAGDTGNPDIQQALQQLKREADERTQRILGATEPNRKDLN